MIKNVKNKLPYPKDVKKEAVSHTANDYLSLRLLCIYFDRLTGAKISAEIPEMSVSLDQDVLSGGKWSFYSNQPDRIKEQLYKEVVNKTSFVATTVKLSNRRGYRNGIKNNRIYFEKELKKDLTE